jgi:hypothetical protein
MNQSFALQNFGGYAEGGGGSSFFNTRGFGETWGGSDTSAKAAQTNRTGQSLSAAKQVTSLGSMIPGVGTAFAVASFGLDVAGMFLGDTSADQAYNEAYGIAMENAKLEARNRQRDAMFKAQLEQVDKQIDNNWIAAWDAWTSEQTRLNEIYDKAAFTSQAMLKQLIEVKGAVAAGERYGKSAGRVANVSTLGAYGRSRAQLAKQLTSERLATTRSMKMTARSLMAANERAIASLAAPTMEIAAQPAYTDFSEPPMVTALKIGQSAASAIKAGYEMTPEGDSFFGFTKGGKSKSTKKTA